MGVRFVIIYVMRDVAKRKLPWYIMALHEYAETILTFGRLLYACAHVYNYFSTVEF